MVTLSQPAGTLFARRYFQMIIALYKYYDQAISEKTVFELVTKAINQNYRPSVSDHIYSLIPIVNIFQRKETFNELLTIGEKLGDSLIDEFECHGKVELSTLQSLIDQAFRLS